MHRLLRWVRSWFRQDQEATRTPSREWMLWIGDGMAPAGPDLIGTPVNIDGRKGVVVDATQLAIQIEWED